MLDRLETGTSVIAETWQQYGLANTRIWLRVVMGFLVLATFNVAILPLHHDVAWHLFAASRMLQGARLYVDLLEYNPPLIYYLNFPAAFAASLSGIPSYIIFMALMVLLILGSCYLSGYLLDKAMPESPTSVRRLMKLTMLFGGMVLTGVNFGQREHIIVLLLLPYLLLIAARLKGYKAPLSLAIPIGLAAGTAASLKPQFVLFWLSLEAYYWYRNRFSWRSVVRPEILVTGLVGLTYIGFVLIRFPEYLSLIAVAEQVYGGYSSDLWLTVFRSVGIPLLAITFFWLLPASPGIRSLRALLAIALLNSWFFAFLALKAWRYHFYPPKFFGLLLLILVVVTLADMPLRKDQVRRSFQSLASLGIVLVLFWQVGSDLRTNSSFHALWEFSDQGILTKMLREEPPGTPVMFLSSSIFPAFPVINYTQVRFAQRLPFLWPVPAFYADGEPMRSPEKMAPAERFALDTVVEDLTRWKPRIVVVDERVQKQGFRDNSFDYLVYYNQDERFRLEWENYQLSSIAGSYKVYRRQAAPAGVRTQVSREGQSGIPMQK